MENGSPPLLRPIPRRPFRLNLTNSTPPTEQEDENLSNFGEHSEGTQSNRFLTANSYPASDAGASISRPDSFLNLTSSTLFGIYSPTASTSEHDPLDATGTPWGTGARTPIRRPSVDDVTYELMRDRSHVKRRRSSLQPVQGARPLPRVTASSQAVRAVVLFLLGLGYGALVTRFHTTQEQHAASLTEDITVSHLNWKYLVFWGVAGVMIGSLLPWFDKFWESSFGMDQAEPERFINNGHHGEDGRLATDWTLVIRTVGVFVGIALAIRKMAWSSTLQASMAVALANPILWWLIDRSKSGFLFSAAVGVAGSLFLLGVDPDMMPTPSQHPLFRNSSSSASQAASGTQSAVLGGLASQETLESGIWMLSVLFCSCVCFGNIGRRLTWRSSMVARGRWAGEK